MIQQLTVILYLFSLAFAADSTIWVPVLEIDATGGCPSPLAKESFNVCTRPPSSSGGCSSVLVDTSSAGPYTRIRGTLTAFQYDSSDGFRTISGENRAGGINGAYVDGISITTSPPREHVWTYAIGLGNPAFDPTNQFPQGTCPCVLGHQPPSFVGSNFFCETGFKNSGYDAIWSPTPLFSNPDACDPASDCCNNANQYFEVVLNQPSTRNLEVRVCGGQGTDNEKAGIRFQNIEVGYDWQCDATWQCQSGSLSYNFVQCKNSRCECRHENGFVGAATPEDPCRCPEGKTVSYQNGVAYCLGPSTTCAGQWQCEGVSENYNFVRCENGACKCLTSNGFVGTAVASDPCRCPEGKSVHYFEDIAYCLAPGQCVGEAEGNYICQSVSEHYRFAECIGNVCACKSGFEGEATVDSLCHCAGNTTWVGEDAFCN